MTTGLYVAAELVPHCQNKFFFSFLPSSPDSCHYLCWCSEGGGCDSEDSSWLAAGDPPLGPGPSSSLPGGGGYPPPTGREDAQSVQECWEGQRRIHVAYCVFTGVIFYLFVHYHTPSGKKMVTGVQVITAPQAQSIRCRWQALFVLPITEAHTSRWWARAQSLTKRNPLTTLGVEAWLD